MLFKLDVFTIMKVLIDVTPSTYLLAERSHKTFSGFFKTWKTCINLCIPCVG